MGKLPQREDIDQGIWNLVEIIKSCDHFETLNSCEGRLSEERRLAL
jgi:tRNA(Phe) wybutosine-synthesizing methylase Tyw3